MKRHSIWCGKITERVEQMYWMQCAYIHVIENNYDILTMCDDVNIVQKPKFVLLSANVAYAYGWIHILLCFIWNCRVLCAAKLFFFIFLSFVLLLFYFRNCWNFPLIFQLLLYKMCVNYLWIYIFVVYSCVVQCKRCTKICVLLPCENTEKIYLADCFENFSIRHYIIVQNMWNQLSLSNNQKM